VHHYRIVCVYGLHRTIVYVHPLYTIICTMLVRRFDPGVTFVFFANSTLFTTSFLKLPCLPSSPPQLLALPVSRSLSFLVSLSIVVLLFLLIVVFFLSLAIHHDEYGDRCFSCCRCYRIVCTYSTGCTVRYYLCTRCTLSFVPCWYDDLIAVSHSFFLRTQHCCFTTSFLKLPRLSSSPPQLLALPLSCFLSFLVSLSIVVLLIVVFFLLFAIHHDEYGDRCFSCCRCYRIVCTYSMGCTVRYYLCTRCTLSFVPCWYDNLTLPSLHLGVTFVCFAKSTHIDHFVLTFAFPFYSDSHNYLSFHSPLALLRMHFILILLCFLQ
jgi:hypothetical protein